MADLIDRQAAIDALEREKTYCTAYKDGYTQTDYFKQYNMGLTDGIKALNKLPSAQTERMICLHGDESVIEILSELRSWFSCFDEKEGLAYHALSFAIKAVKAQADMRGGDAECRTE